MRWFLQKPAKQPHGTHNKSMVDLQQRKPNPKIPHKHRAQETNLTLVPVKQMLSTNPNLR